MQSDLRSQGGTEVLKGRGHRLPLEEGNLWEERTILDMMLLNLKVEAGVVEARS